MEYAEGLATTARPPLLEQGNERTIVMELSDQTVTIYRDKENRFGGRDAWSISTTAANLDQFVQALSVAMSNSIQKSGGAPADELQAILQAALPIAFKLSGYKADAVRELRTLISGATSPSHEARYADSENTISPAGSSAQGQPIQAVAA